MVRKGTILKTVFDEYKIIKQIGQGGSGTVFLAQNSDNEQVAIKTIEITSSNKEKIKRFKNEINFCYKTEHKNIIKVLDFGRIEEHNESILFYVMPCYHYNLRQVINAKIAGNNVIEIFKQILHGLNYAHSKGVFHRDLKPENILCTTDLSNVVIADWGIAHFCEDELITSIETKNTSRLANFTYAAPEQKDKNQEVTERSDVFPLGLILNEMFTHKVIAGINYETISNISADYGYLDNLVEHLIEQEPENRIYPINKIIIELCALMKEHDEQIKKEQIIAEQIEADTSDDPLFHPVSIINAEFNDGVLEIHLDKLTNELWNKILISGDYSHTCTMNYDPSYFDYKNIDNHTVYYVTIRNLNPESIKRIVQYFKEWLESTTCLYKQKIIAQREQQYQKEIMLKEQKLKELHIKSEINTMLKDLI